MDLRHVEVGGAFDGLFSWLVACEVGESRKIGERIASQLAVELKLPIVAE